MTADGSVPSLLGAFQSNSKENLFQDVTFDPDWWYATHERKEGNGSDIKSG